MAKKGKGKRPLKLKKNKQLFWGKGKDIGFGFLTKIHTADNDITADKGAIGEVFAPYDINKGEKFVEVFNPHAQFTQTSVVPMDKIRGSLEDSKECKALGGTWDKDNNSCKL